MIYTISRSALAFIWLWHGLVPKLIVRHPDEYIPLNAMDIDQSTAETIVAAAGWGEIAFGLLLLVLWRARWPLWLSIAAMAGLLLGVFFTAPVLALGAFNPVTLNVLVITVAVIAILSHPSGTKQTQNGTGL